MNAEKFLVAEFTVPGEPASKARARFTNYGSKVRTYTPAKTTQAEQVMAHAYLSVAARHDNDTEIAYGVVAEFMHQTRQRRDVDNLLKLILDGLNGVAWPDDNQVTFVQGSKRLVPKGEAKTHVAIYNLGRIYKPRGRCIRCSVEFAEYASQNRKFCSRECCYAYRIENRTRACLNCGEAYQAPSPASLSVYCSMACTSAHKSVTVTCVVCGTGFNKARSLLRSGNHYCSAECKEGYWRSQRKSAAKGTCQDCGGPTTKKTYKRCRDCLNAAGGRWAS